MRAAVYLRISEDRTGEELGIQRQREDAQKLINDRGWASAGEYADNDRSAASGKQRPEFDALMRACEAGQVDAIVAWSHDRLTRNRRDELRLIETCQDRNITIALVRGSDIDLTTPAGRMTADILASVARHEIEQKGERTRRANLQAARAGKPPGGPRIFGYERDGKTPRPVEAEAIRQAYGRILQGGSIGSIVRAWNAAGLYSDRPSWKTGKQAPWSTTGVRRLLLNARQAGLREYKGEIVGTAEWPANVDQATFYAVQNILNRPERNSARARGDRRLLTGFAVCDTCGHTVNGGRNQWNAPAYICLAREGPGPHVHRQSDPIDNHIGDLVVDYLSRPDVSSSVFAPARDNDESDLVRQVEELNERLESLATDYAEGLITSAQLRSGSERVRELLNEAERRLIAAADTSPDLVGLIDAEDVRAAWEELDPERQRAVIETVFDEIRLAPPGRGARRFDPATVKRRWRRADAGPTP